MSYSVGAQNGMTIDLAAGSDRGTGSGSDSTNVNTYVTATNSATIKSGGNTTLNGAVVQAETVKADVGGDLRIQSQQDTSTATAKQSGKGFDASICYFWCYGTPVVAGGSVNTAGGKGQYASVTEQSGIQAGDGGFDVKVVGNTNLVGGVIASTDQAVDGGKNSFTTGSLTMTDVVNVDASRASGYSVAAGYGTGATSSAGLGSASGTRTSTTASGISGVAGNAGVRTGDSANALTRDWTPGGLLTDVNAQIAITASFSQNASSAWGQYANERYVDAVKQGDEEAAGCWGPDGNCRAAGHAVVGGLSGGVVGAVGAGLSSEMAPAFADFLHQNDVPEAIVEALTVAAASGVSSVFGAGAAAGAFNESANNAIVAVPLILEALVAAGEAAVLACVRSPKCVGVIGAAVLNNLLSTNSSQNQDDANSGSGAGPTGGNQADTYGTPPDGDDDHRVANGVDARAEVRRSAEPYWNSGQAFNVGSEAELESLFGRLTQNSEQVNASGYNGTMRVLPDGTRVGLRTGSETGGKTIDVFPRVGKAFKVHIKP